MEFPLFLGFMQIYLFIFSSYYLVGREILGRSQLITNH